MLVSVRFAVRSQNEELEAIMAIYIDEVTVDEEPDGTKNVQLVLHPATAENVDQQYVCITLILKLSKEYPNEIPEIVIRNPRGLSDEELYTLKKDLMKKAEENQGNEMLYQLIELGKEYLTTGNCPSCECTICLYNFLEADVFLKTECYHYFHSYCLARYAEKPNDCPGSVKTILCPVCRVEITYQIPQNKDEFPPPVEEINDSCDVNNSMLKEQQKILSEIYEKQKANGGIIDLEQEKTKFLLNISAPSSVNEIEVTPEEASSAPTKNKLANDDGTKKCTGESNQSQYFRKNNYDNKNDYRNRSKHYNFKDVQPNSANFVMSESSKDSANDDGTKKCTGESNQSQYFRKNNYDNKNDYRNRSKHYNFKDVQPNSANFVMSESSKDSANDDGTKKCTGESNQSQYFRKNNYDNKNDCRNRSKHYNFKDVQPNSANSLTSESSKDSYAKQQDLQNHKSDSKVFNNFCQKPNENYYTRSKHYNHYNTKPNSAHFKKSRSSQNSSFTKQQNLQNPSNDISDSRVSDNSQSQNAVGVEFTKQNCGDSQKTKSYKKPFSKTQQDNTRRDRNVAANSRSSKYQTYKNQNFFHSQNLKSQGDSSSAKHKDFSKNVDHDPKMDEGQIHRQPVSRARKPRVGKSDECSSLSTTTSRKNEKTCSDISNDISTNVKKLSDKLSVTASVGNLSIEPSVKPPPGFLPKFKNLKGVPPPGFTSR
ncbi:E3 ubiquitin-protein ligase RNF25 [Nymphon striatum]|nr:E3 ubiquitin-protein ligase RNF25 [Nymphon striatum]